MRYSILITLAGAVWLSVSGSQRIDLCRQRTLTPSEAASIWGGQLGGPAQHYRCRDDEDCVANSSCDDDGDCASLTEEQVQPGDWYRCIFYLNRTCDAQDSQTCVLTWDCEDIGGNCAPVGEAESLEQAYASCTTGL